jgi:heme-degrading monooxygenase HmoA
MEEPRMDRPLPDAVACARALEALLAMLRPRRRRPLAAELPPPSALSAAGHVGPLLSAFSTSRPRPEYPYIIVWEFLARHGEERRFEDAFGATGDWVRLFKQAPGYLGTQLCRDARNARRYATVDYWTSPDAYRAFRVRWRESFDAIDERCRALTEREVCVGAFLLPAGVDLRLTP